MKVEAAQRIVRKASPGFFVKQEALPVFNPPRQKEVSGPSTLAELSDALRHPLPLPPAPPPCQNALEAFASWKPLTMEMVRDIIAKERAAREVIMQEYAERTGQAVDYCDECDLGVVEEETEVGWQTVVTPRPCDACDGLGVRIL